MSRSRPESTSEPTVAAYRDGLVAWYREHQRDLPWRREPTPWRVWVSEIMLQQTRVEAVIPYFLRFLDRFPTPEALAAASEEEALEAWSGLGYYRRVRMLQAGARTVVEDYDGEFPWDFDEILALPGVGRYTAGAIASIALEQRAPIVDGNVIRVLTRIFGVEGDVSKAATSKQLWALAREVVEVGKPSEVNQAQMEFGALLCLPRNPKCDACPCAAFCVARATDRIEDFPQLPPKKKSVDVERDVLLVRRGAKVLLRRRRDDELLPGLWDFPGCFTGRGGDVSTDLDFARGLLPFPVEIEGMVGTHRHGITHRRITLRVHAARTKSRATRGEDGAELQWVDPIDALDLALSSPARRILQKFAAQQPLLGGA